MEQAFLYLQGIHVDLHFTAVFHLDSWEVR